MAATRGPVNNARVPYRLLYTERRRSELPSSVWLGCSVPDKLPLVLEDADRSTHLYMCGVTGAGKSRLLEHMIVQDIALGHPMCVIDPTGHLYRQILEFVACGIEQLSPNGPDVGQVLARYLFLNIDDAENPVRLNPLEPQEGETTEEQVDDFLKAAERLFGSLEEMRRLRNVLRGTLWVIAELNRLPAAARPHVAPWSYPLGLQFASEFLSLGHAERIKLVEALPSSALNNYVRAFWVKFFGRFSVSQAAERLESTWNILQYFLGDSLVARFFDVQRSTLHVPRLMREGTSLFTSLPLGKNMKGAQLIGTFLATKFQRAAYRRALAERRRPYYLYIDEFQEFADLEFAKAATTLRQYNLRLINAHQSQSQPPFHTVEGRSILETIKGNAGVKVLFRLTREDAEAMSKAIYELTQRRLNFLQEERSSSVADTNGTTRTQSSETSESETLTWSSANAEAWARSDSFAVGRSSGTNIGRTLTAQVGVSMAQGLSESIGLSEAEGITEVHSKGHSLALAIGENWTHLVDCTRGLTFTKREGESLAIQRGSSATLTAGEQEGHTERRGGSNAVSDSVGNQLVRTEGGSAAYHHYGGEMVEATTKSSTALGELEQTARSQSETFDTALSQIRSVTEAVGASRSDTTTRSRDRSQGASVGWGEHSGEGQSEIITQQTMQTEALGRNVERGSSYSSGRSYSLTEQQQRSLAEAFTLLEQVSRTYSEALQRTISRTELRGGSVQQGVSQGEAVGQAQSRTTTAGTTERKTYFSLEGEREVTINELQKLAPRHCVVSKTALGAVEIETLNLPDRWYDYRSRNLPAIILKRQAERIGEAATTSSAAPAEPVGVRSFGNDVSDDHDDDSPFAF